MVSKYRHSSRTIIWIVLYTGVAQTATALATSLTAFGPFYAKCEILPAAAFRRLIMCENDVLVAHVWRGTLISSTRPGLSLHGHHRERHRKPEITCCTVIAPRHTDPPQLSLNRAQWLPPIKRWYTCSLARACISRCRLPNTHMHTRTHT